jgi:hopanoid biosynthesis associated protein HpnK
MQVIFNADDFGTSPAINQAVLLAHRQGVLTSASLMMNGPACQEAVQIACQNPALAVGLHLVLVAGNACLPPASIPHLVDQKGRFSSNPLHAGLVYFYSKAARRELSDEIAAQFARFAATGLPLDHVNGHLHFHLHPSVLPIVLQQAVAHGAAGVRLPRDELGLSLRVNLPEKMAWALEFTALNRWAANQLTGLPLAVTCRVYGLMQSGCMAEPYVARVLAGLQVDSAELYFHPSLDPQVERLGPSPADFTTLVSPDIRQLVARRKLELSSYAALRKS